MKSRSALLLQAAVVLIGVGALVFLLGEPHLEGRNAHATLFEVYFNDPFLVYVYVGAIPFFMALHRAFTLLGQVRRKGAFSQESVTALRSIQRCAVVMLGFVAGGVVIILMFGDKDDRPAGLFMGFLAATASGMIAIVAAQFARHGQNALKRPESSQS